MDGLWELGWAILFYGFWFLFLVVIPGLVVWFLLIPEEDKEAIARKKRQKNANLKPTGKDFPSDR